VTTKSNESKLPSRAKGLPNVRRVWLPVAAVCVIGLGGWSIQHTWISNGSGSGEITATVTRTDLPIVVTERGTLESANTVTAKCQVEGEMCKIVFLVPEGSHVKKGDVVVRFDADKLHRNVAEAGIKFKTAEGKAKQAKEELDVQKNKAETEIAKAQLALELAILDREKYLEGDFKVEVDDKKGAINISERELKEAQVKLTAFRIFVKKGFGTPEQLAIKELEVEKSKNNLERDKAKLMVLEVFMRKRQEVELRFKEKDAERELARVKSTANANIAKSETDYETALEVTKLEKDQLERARKQLDHVQITAPQEGIVVFDQSRFWDPSSRIQLGGMVGYQQPVFQLPDLESMQVKVKIHESKVKKIRVGQKADIRVEAIPGLVLHGIVERVATVADSEGSWRNGGAKEFETILKIVDLAKGAGLKPGFSAEVGIEVNRLPDVLVVPVQAVAQRDGKHYAYTPTASGIERCEVTVGENNEKFVELQAGLEQGATVCMDARARSNAEAQLGDAASGKGK
jgi:HlyD family secretion protein